MDLHLRGLWGRRREPVVAGDEAAAGGRSLSGVRGVDDVQAEARGAEDAGGLKARARKDRLWAEERAAYWEFAREISERSGLESEACYCALRKADFEDLLECLKRMEELAA